MARSVGVVCVLLMSNCLWAQTTSSSSAFAISLAQQSMAAQTGAGVADVTLNANVISTVGAGYDTGTATLQAKGLGESRVDLNLTGGILSEARTVTSGVPSGAWKKSTGAVTAFPQHNCWTEAAWFFPALSSLSQSANPNFVFGYVGPEQHDGISSQHIRIFQFFPQDTNNAWNVPGLSAVDVFLDPVSFLPLAMDFNTHPDTDMDSNIPVEIRFANYQPINGLQVPTHVQKLLNGSLILDISVTNVVANSGLLDSNFSLQ